MLRQVRSEIPRVEFEAQRGRPHVGGLERREVLVDGRLVREVGVPAGGDALRDRGEPEGEDVEEALIIE